MYSCVEGVEVEQLEVGEILRLKLFIDGYVTLEAPVRMPRPSIDGSPAAPCYFSNTCKYTR